MPGDGHEEVSSPTTRADEREAIEVSWGHTGVVCLAAPSSITRPAGARSPVPGGAPSAWRREERQGRRAGSGHARCPPFRGQGREPAAAWHRAGGDVRTVGIPCPDAGGAPDPGMRAGRGRSRGPRTGRDAGASTWPTACCEQARCSGERVPDTSDSTLGWLRGAAPAARQSCSRHPPTPVRITYSTHHGQVTCVSHVVTVSPSRTRSSHGMRRREAPPRYRTSRRWTIWPASLSTSRALAAACASWTSAPWWRRRADALRSAGCSGMMGPLGSW